jgi:endonuclease/exonuclease/phosphatase family metal-dependent hydrolase
MTVAKIHWQGESFYFINTHLHTRGGRETQLEVVLQEFAKYPRAILLGDFNSRAATPLLANALKDVEITDAVAAAGLDMDNPERIDWILTKGFTVEGGKMLEKGVSDHPYYQVQLSYKM